MLITLRAIRVKARSNAILVALRHIKRKKAPFRLMCIAQVSHCLNFPILWYAIT